ncbi:MAG: glycosyltransferase family 39 protein [Anaerolineae bacterium]|nr:glycosyltransferase family 39 protein [Anaerolineae bacterium]
MKTKPVQQLVWWGLIIILLLLAFAARVWALEAVPPGLTHDEASNGHDSAAILEGTHRIYFPVGYGHEPLYNYSVAALTLLLGQSIFTLRLTTVLWSLCTWICTIALARRWWGRRAACWAGASLALSFWPLMMARVGLRGPTLPALLTAAALAYDHAITTKTWRHYLLTGFFLGLSFYTYMASRGMPLLYIGFLLFLLATDRAKLRQVWTGTVCVILVALIIGAPLFLYLYTHPELELRIAQLGGALTALRAGDWQPMWKNITDALPMLLWRADPYWLYNIAHRPGLEPLLAAFFLAGIGIALTHLKDSRNSFLLLWLSGGIAPALLTTIEYNTLHAIAALPAVYLLIALGFDTACKIIVKMIPVARRGLIILMGLGIIFNGINATHDYFLIWGENRHVRVSYHQHIVALGRQLEKVKERTPIVISSIYPGEFHDPYVLEVTLRRDDLDTRWSDGHYALFFPETTTRVYTHTLAPLHPVLHPLLFNFSQLEMTLQFEHDDLISALYAYIWDADAAWNHLSAHLSQTTHVAAGDLPPRAYHNEVLCPINYSDSLLLLGYQVFQENAAATNTITVLTAWQVHGPPEGELVIFTHLLNENGDLITQQDRLDTPAWQWQPGDRFVQIHILALPPNLPGGSYRIAVGVYQPTTLQRLPLRLPEADAGPVTRVLLPLEIEP